MKDKKRKYTVIQYTVNCLPILKGEVKTYLETAIPMSLKKAPQLEIVKTVVEEDHFILYMYASWQDLEEMLDAIPCLMCNRIKEKFPSFMEDNFGSIKDHDGEYPCMWGNRGFNFGYLSDGEIKEIHREWRKRRSIKTLRGVKRWTPECKDEPII